MTHVMRRDAVERLTEYFRAYRRARAKLGKATLGVNLDERLDQYWQIWCDSPKRLLARFAAPHNKDLVEYLMHLVDIADRGDITTTDPHFFHLMEDEQDE